VRLSGRWFSRISIRLLAFNLLLVFLPVAGTLFLGAYESRLESAEVRAITEEARIVAAAVGGGGVKTFEAIVLRRSTDVRLRLVDGQGNLIADSHRIVPPPAVPPPAGSKRHNTLYRIGAFLVRPVVKFMQPPQPPLDVDFYETATKLTGVEVRDALRGVEGFDKKITAGGKRSVTLYRAVPVMMNGKVTGAVVASRNTFPILQDLYAIRLGVMRIFLASVVVAILVSLFFSATILAPLRQLRVDARSILDRRGRIRGHFKGSKRLDEIGELSRALERITRRLETHVHAIETFTADVSHEFKNPLASIRTANDMVADVVDPAVRKRFVQMIDQEVARMERLLSGVREVSRIDAQLVREERHPVVIGELLSKIVEGFRLREGERVRFELDVAGEPVVEASEDRLLQVYENLLDNAVSFSPDGGVVRISASVSEGVVVTRVSDEGSGISEPHMNRIFDRFFTYRPDASRRSHTGLGLAIVKTIVQGYGGTISASNAEKGAVFEIRLPRA
jgi:two-component system, OmpR family, sensor histidine kinase ChvG